jgi:acetyl esterase/lipase
MELTRQVTCAGQWLLSVLLFVVGCWPSAAKAIEPTRQVVTSFEVAIASDISYYEGKDTDAFKHKLDLYLPRGAKDAPVLFFVHGGAWRHGDKRYLGIYSTLGLHLAQHGIVTVIPNYRLTPAVTHPEHIKDIARAFAWTHSHIADYGGRPDEIFVSGHSAGGHLAALLATNDAYLKEQGLGVDAIRGVIPMSGIYDLSDKNRLFDATFGDTLSRNDAAPLCHIRCDAPPFLIIYADRDLPLCGKVPSEQFCRALLEKKCEAQTLEVKHRNHMTLLLNAIVDDDPVAQAIHRFIHSHTRKKS